MKCPECGEQLTLQPPESEQSSGPPSAWSERVDARVWCEYCEWESEEPREYFE